MKKSYSVFVETVSGYAGHIFAENRTPMIQTDSKTYHEIASRIAGEIGTADYFNGTVEYGTDEFDSTFTATLLVYRQENQMPEGRRKVVEDVKPVWWNFTTIMPEEGEVINDFSFPEFRRCLLDAMNG